MKIGVITFWQSQDNYGQILQCWALQFYLTSIGHDAYLIRYTHNAPHPLLTEQIKKILKIYPILKKVYRLLHKKQSSNDIIPSIQRGFDIFKDKYIKQSTKIYHNLSELQKNPPIADCYIVGSDQVWAQLLQDKNNEVFFLNFGKKGTKRISYAASFAMNEYPKQLLNKLAKQLRQFQAISVREKNGIDICKAAGANAHHVLDPTLIIEKESYMPFIRKNTFKNYIFFYIINITSPKTIYYKELQEYFHNYEFIYTTASGLNQITFNLNNSKHVYPNIEDWLSLIYYSELVITTSFHGVALCIRLNKPFLFFPLEDAYATSNNRVIDLLETLELSNRIVNNIKDLDTIIHNSIKWNAVNQKLAFLSKESKSFLEEQLQ